MNKQYITIICTATITTTIVAATSYLYFERRGKMNKELQIPDFLKSEKNYQEDYVNSLEQEVRRESQSFMMQDQLGNENNYMPKKEPLSIPDEPAERYSHMSTRTKERTTMPVNNNYSESGNMFNKESIAGFVKGLTDDDMEILLDNISIELMFNRVGKELERHKKFYQNISAVVDDMK